MSGREEGKAGRLGEKTTKKTKLKRSASVYYGNLWNIYPLLSINVLLLC